MPKIMRVDVGAKTVSLADPGEYRRWGGRGLTSMIVGREVPPACHPLGGKNKLVLAPGLLSGTMAANSGRLSVGAKSPLTGGIKESNVGGTAAAKLGRLGLRGIVIEGQPAAGALYYLLINPSGGTLLPADEFKGLKNYDLVARLKQKHGDKVTVISIGPAGEFKMSGASVAVTDMEGYPSRHAGRGGLGAVMGAKGLKAVVIDDKGAVGVELADKEAFRAAAGVFRDTLTKHPVTKPGNGMSVNGTNGMLGLINAVGALPTRNFSAGQFEAAAKIGGEALHDLIIKRGGRTDYGACTNCVIHCGNIVNDAAGNYLTSALEYETVWAHGANCGVDDLDSIARIDRLCDEYGLDTMDLGCAIAVAMEAGLLPFGDAAGALKLVEEVGQGTPLGRILGNGAAFTGQAFGVARVPVVKRQSIPAYDPRAIKGMGATFATTPQGADHTAGYAVMSNLMRMGGFVPPLQAEGQAQLSKRLQINTAILDALGLCTFTDFALVGNAAAFESLANMAAAVLGEALSPDALIDYGRNILLAESAFNRAAGFSPSDDRLPEFFKTEPLAPHNTVFDVADAELDGVSDW